MICPFQAYKYCCHALRDINMGLPAKAVVDVVRQCAKACVVKREFKKADMLVKFAVQFSKSVKA